MENLALITSPVGILVSSLVIVIIGLLTTIRYLIYKNANLKKDITQLQKYGSKSKTFANLEED